MNSTSRSRSTPIRRAGRGGSSRAGRDAGSARSRIVPSAAGAQIRRRRRRRPPKTPAADRPVASGRRPAASGTCSASCGRAYSGRPVADYAVRLPDDPDHGELLPQAIGEVALLPASAGSPVGRQGPFAGAAGRDLQLDHRPGADGGRRAAAAAGAAVQPALGDEPRPRRPVRLLRPEPVRHVRHRAAVVAGPAHRRRRRAAAA